MTEMDSAVEISLHQLIQVLEILEYLEENHDRNRRDSVLYQELVNVWVANVGGVKT
jgi:hypothetical protein